VMSPLEFMKLPIQRLLCGSQVRRCYVSSGSGAGAPSTPQVGRLCAIDPTLKAP
jgi:hypothetical protein